MKGNVVEVSLGFKFARQSMMCEGQKWADWIKQTPLQEFQRQKICATSKTRECGSVMSQNGSLHVGHNHERKRTDKVASPNEWGPKMSILFCLHLGSWQGERVWRPTPHTLIFCYHPSFSAVTSKTTPRIFFFLQNSFSMWGMYSWLIMNSRERPVALVCCLHYGWPTECPKRRVGFNFWRSDLWLLTSLGVEI